MLSFLDFISDKKDFTSERQRQNAKIVLTQCQIVILCAHPHNDDNIKLLSPIFMRQNRVDFLAKKSVLLFAKILPHGFGSQIKCVNFQTAS